MSEKNLNIEELEKELQEEDKRIANARRNVPKLLSMVSIDFESLPERTDGQPKLTLHQLLSWCKGSNDDLNNNLPMLADLFGITLEELTADTLTFSPTRYLEVE